MKRVGHLFLLPVLLATLAMPVAARAADEVNVFMWEATPPGGLQPGQRPDFLVGTMHVKLKAGMRLPRAMQRHIASASRFAMEVNLGDTSPALVSKYIRLEPGQDLKVMLGPVTWKKLLKQSARMGMRESQLRNFDPWFVALSFLPQDATPDSVMDSRLRAFAEENHVKVDFLETAEDQLRTMDSVSLTEDLQQLREILDDPTKPAKELAALERAYAKGDLAAVERYVLDPERIKGYPDFYEKLFYKRNAAWLDRIDTLLRDEDAVVAVGLGHMLGDKGLLRLLEKRGWTMSPVTP